MMLTVPLPVPLSDRPAGPLADTFADCPGSTSACWPDLKSVCLISLLIGYHRETPLPQEYFVFV